MNWTMTKVFRRCQTIVGDFSNGKCFVSKIFCDCGQVIRDQTDCLPYKAYALADQDLDTLLNLLDLIGQQSAAAVARFGRSAGADFDMSAIVKDAIDSSIGEILDLLHSKHIYQCSNCGRLFFEGEIFVPKDDTVPKNLMRSIDGDKWKRPLCGNWREWKDGPLKGELWWGFGCGDEGFEQYEDIEVLKKRYFEVFARLQEAGVLSSASLRNGDVILHEWRQSSTE